LLDALPYAKRLELEGRERAGLHAALAGLALLILGTARVRAGGLVLRQLVFPPGGKPRCEGGPWFSIAHTRARVVCAISEGVDPGVDIESVATTASVEERDTLRRWTATEAALKAAGLGMRNVAQVRLDATLGYAEVGSRRYLLRELQLAEGCICHIAAIDVLPALEIRAVNLDAPETSLAIERSLGFAAQAE
jgi:phosphopantetheinyl transferase